MSGQDSAFPGNFPGRFSPSGLTKRELFAAMAMQGICASPFENEADDPIRSDALMAVRLADALLAALEAT